MKLIHYTYLRLFALLFILLSVWGVLFYFTMMHEVMDETDDRLLNNKGLVVHRMLTEPERLQSKDTITENYSIKRVDKQTGMRITDEFYDSDMYIQHENEYEPTRVYKSSFRDKDGQYYAIELYLSTIERDNVIENILFYLVLLFVILFMVVSLGMRFILNRSFAPLKKLLIWLNSIVPGKPSPVLETKTEIAEFNQLMNAAIDMQTRSLQAYDEQKQFISNAAHELQTPLAVALNRLELLADNDQLDEEQLQAITVVFDTLHNAVKLNKSLLLLSRIQNEQFTEQSDVQIDKVARKLLDDLLEINEGRNIQVSFEIESPMNVRMNDALATILITNLIKNAIIHSSTHALVSIKINSERFEIRNWGNKALDTNKIFTRFYRSDNQTNNKSNGLGLSIASSIAKLSKLSLSYQFDGEHIFTLTKVK